MGWREEGADERGEAGERHVDKHGGNDGRTEGSDDVDLWEVASTRENFVWKYEFPPMHQSPIIIVIDILYNLQ